MKQTVLRRTASKLLEPVFAARCYASAALAVMWCPSVHPCVCVSVMFVNSVKTDQHIFNIFFTVG